MPWGRAVFSYVARGSCGFHLLDDTAMLFQFIAIGNAAAGKAALLCKLFQAGLGTHRALDAFAGRLPVADIV